MLVWLKSLKDDNKIKLIVVILGILFAAAYFGKSWNDSSSSLFPRKPSTQRNTDTVNGSIAPSQTETDDINIGINLEQYKQVLKEREAEVKAELKQVHAKNRQLLETDSQGIQRQLQDLEASHKGYINSLKERIVQLESLRGQLPDAVLEQAKSALEKGDSQRADQIFEQIEEQVDIAITVTAEAAYQRSQIAKDAIHYADAYVHSQKAARLLQGNAVYLSAAGTLAQILGRYSEAIDYFEQALTSDLNTYGEDHPFVARDRNNLGLTWDFLGEYQKAIEYYSLTLTSDLNSFGEAHPFVAIGRNNLGSAWNALKNYPKAIEYFELALTSNLKTYGDDHPIVATNWNNLGMAWQALGEYQKAIEYLELALVSDLKTYGEDHPFVARDRNNLGSAWDFIGEYQKAIEYYTLALASCEIMLGKDHPNTQLVQRHLTDTRNKMKQSVAQ
ncbi:MAG: tetratricopeptide repeat protein [Methylococcales bacterium]